MRIFPLDSNSWELSCDIAPGRTIPATVPGNVQSDLWRAGMRPDLYVGRGADAYRDLEGKTWTYRRTFDLPNRNEHPAWFLVFDGLDYHAEITLNGRVLGAYEGQMTQVIFSVGSLLQDRNELIVTLLPIQKAPLPDRAWIDPYVPERHDGRWLAKSMMGFGWDFAPRFVPIGIWRPVRLVGTGGPFLLHPRTDQKFNDDLSRVDVRFVLEYLIQKEQQGSLTLQLFDPDNRLIQTEEIPANLEPGTGQIEIGAIVENPRLWWPNGLGDSPLYRVKAEFRADGRALADLEFPVGFRKLEMVRSAADEKEKLILPSGSRKWETSFVVNRQPFYYRGSNFVPPDILYGSITDERLRRLIDLAREANINLLRVWGGGAVLSDNFYRYADEAGILIWQEFPLGCTDHSGNDHYAEVLQAEARCIVRQLRHHPCLAVWCGGNELWQYHSGMAPQDKLLRMLSAVCYELDPDRPFLPSTPYPGALHGPYSFDGAGAGRELYDQVDWCNRLTHAAYNECGVAGPPHADIMRRVLPPEQLWPPRRGTDWEFHKAFNAWGDGKAWLNLELIEEYFGSLKDPDDLARAGQFLQAIGLQYLVEELRRRWPDVPGTVTWCFNEPWTSLANCSVLAYPDRPKPAYEALKRAYRPVDVSARLEHFVLLPGEKTGMTLFLLNDTRTAVPEGTVTAVVESVLDGRRTGEFSETTPSVLPGGRLALKPMTWTAPDTPRGVFRAKVTWNFGADVREKEYWFGLGADSGKARRNPNQAFEPLLKFWREYGFSLSRK